MSHKRTFVRVDHIENCKIHPQMIRHIKTYAMAATIMATLPSDDPDCSYQYKDFSCDELSFARGVTLVTMSVTSPPNGKVEVSFNIINARNAEVFVAEDGTHWITTRNIP